MRIEDLQAKIQEQADDLKKLKAKEEAFRKSLKKNWRFSLFMAQKGTRIFLGQTLLKSSTSLFLEIEKGTVNSNTLGQVFAHIIMRFIRVGLFGVLLTVLPMIFIALQTYLLSRQNQLLQLQNEKIDQQTYLIESQRRNALVYELGNVLNAISEETNNGQSKDISDLLVGRIASLSRSFRPYRYFQGDSLSKELSPERGQLLFSLIESELSNNTLTKIYQRSDFSQSDLQGVNISFNNIFRSGFSLSESVNPKSRRLASIVPGSTIQKEVFLSRVDLSESDMREAQLQGVILKYTDLENTLLVDADLSSADLQGAYLFKTKCHHTLLLDANLQDAYMRGTQLTGANLSGANLANAILIDANLAGAQLNNTNLTNTDLSGTLVESASWFDELRELPIPPKGLDALRSQYEIVEINDRSISPNYRLRKKAD